MKDLTGQVNRLKVPIFLFSRSQSPLWERNVLSSVTKQGLGNESRSWWLMKQKSALTVSTVSRFLKLDFLEWTHIIMK